MPSLVEKLAAVAKTVPNLAKEGENGQYSWLRAADIFDAVRVKLFEAGILIFPIAQSVERSTPYLAATGDITDEVILTVTFRVTDGVESVECCAHGIGQDHEGKALYMASTGAKKDLLRTLFLIAGFEDDSESVQDTSRIAPDLSAKISEMEAKCGPDVRSWTIGRFDVNAWMSACRATHKTTRSQKAFLKLHGVEKISDLKRKDFAYAMKWATDDFAEVENGEVSSGTESDATD